MCLSGMTSKVSYLHLQLIFKNLVGAAQTIHMVTPALKASGKLSACFLCIAGFNYHWFNTISNFITSSVDTYLQDKCLLSLGKKMKLVLSNRMCVVNAGAVPDTSTTGILPLGHCLQHITLE